MSTILDYPFSQLDPPAFYCKKNCGRLIRYCNMHQRLYEVVEGNGSEILTNKPHHCGKSKSKP